jgi:hypothetical protein
MSLISAKSAFILACITLAETNPKLPPETAQEVCAAVEFFAEAQGFDPELIAAIAWVESRFNPAAKSPAGARGVMQVILGKSWSPDYSESEILQPWSSVEAGVMMAVRWRSKKGPDWLECYNSGVSCRNRAYRASVEAAVTNIGNLKRMHVRANSVRREFPYVCGEGT